MIEKFSVSLIVYKLIPIVEFAKPLLVSHSLNILFIKVDFPDFFFPNTPIIYSSSYKILVLNFPNKYDCLTKAKNPFLLSSSSIKLFIISFIAKIIVELFLFSFFKLS